MRRRLASLLRIPGDEDAVPIFVAMRRAIAAGYDRKTFTADVLAGLVVGIVAIPLSMALSIAVDLPPENGLYTAVVAGMLVAFFGGSKFQVTGPTAAFVVILAPVVGKYGLGGLLMAGLMAGVILVGMGVLRFGRLLQFIPHPVTTGFTAGIATVIATLQLRDFLGLRVADAKTFTHLEFPGKVGELWHARATVSPVEIGIGAGTLLLLIYGPRVTRRIPAPLFALAIGSVAALVLHRLFPSIDAATIGSRYTTPAPPHLVAPWTGQAITVAHIRELMPAAFAIAMLGAIESLLSAVIADGMTGKRHDSNAELVALGIGNIVAPFFGGIAATGALARTATNIRAGARTPVAAIVHSFVVLLFMLLLSRLVAYVPMASLAALLLLVAWNMSEIRHAIGILRIAPKSDVAVLATCYVLTVVFDMVVAVSVGVMLAALLFMRRMSELTQGRAVLVSEEGTDAEEAIPKGIILYEIAGPMFFGAAQNAIGQLDHIGTDVKVLILDLGRVPTIDATGMVALQSSLRNLQRLKTQVVIVGLLPHPRKVLEKAELFKDAPIADDRKSAIRMATELMAQRLTEPPPPSTRS